MATRKMTFSLPVSLAERLLKRVPARDRSRFLAQALESRLAEEEKALARSCELANQDRDAAAIETDWYKINDRLEEPWGESSPQ